MRLRLLAALLAATLLPGQTPPTPPRHGIRPQRLVIRKATVVDGSGTPAAGPKDIVIEGNRIVEVIASDPVSLQVAGRQQAQGDVEIDASGKYVLPGFINLHGHLHEERGGKPQPLEYELKLWLACGITTVRDVGSNFKKALEYRTLSAQGKLEAPRLFLYPFFNSRPTPSNRQEAAARVREFKQAGADGIKFLGVNREVMEGLMQEAKAQGLRTAHHAGVEETNAWDDVRLGTTSIEHWYGIPDAAIPAGVQNFPPSYNYNNELDRFRYAGRLWREADPKRLREVLAAMVKAGVAWDPTLNIYEAARDLQRAQTQPWFAQYLHPTLDQFFRPNLANHGSFYVNWTTEDEIYWKENYRIWMQALRDFDRAGGLIGLGEDTGFIYQLYGFGLLRGLELHQEAGFHPLKVVQQATSNGARVLGHGELGLIRKGYLADVLVVNGNPLENFKILYPATEEGQAGAKDRGIEWTIKDGIPYHAPTLAREVRGLVKRARSTGPGNSQ